MLLLAVTVAVAVLVVVARRRVSCPSGSNGAKFPSRSCTKCLKGSFQTLRSCSGAFQRPASRCQRLAQCRCNGLAAVPTMPACVQAGRKTGRQ